jgi:hypothetical protein
VTRRRGASSLLAIPEARSTPYFTIRRGQVDDPSAARAMKWRDARKEVALVGAPGAAVEVRLRVCANPSECFAQAVEVLKVSKYDPAAREARTRDIVVVEPGAAPAAPAEQGNADP